MGKVEADEADARLDAFEARLEAALEPADFKQLMACLNALAWYGDPDTYFAIGMFPDPPNGEFMDDFEDLDWYQGASPKPGKRARAALLALGS